MRALMIGGGLINVMAFLLCLHVALRDAFTNELIAAMCANVTIVVGLFVIKQFKGV